MCQRGLHCSVLHFLLLHIFTWYCNCFIFDNILLLKCFYFTFIYNQIFSYFHILPLLSALCFFSYFPLMFSFFFFLFLFLISFYFCYSCFVSQMRKIIESLEQIYIFASRELEQWLNFDVLLDSRWSLCDWTFATFSSSALPLFPNLKIQGVFRISLHTEYILLLLACCYLCWIKHLLQNSTILLSLVK